jgi:hypothetical protein
LPLGNRNWYSEKELCPGVSNRSGSVQDAENASG